MAIVITRKMKRILLVVLGVLILGGGGFLVWRLNQDDTVAPTDSDASVGSCVEGSSCTQRFPSTQGEEVYQQGTCNADRNCVVENPNICEWVTINSCSTWERTFVPGEQITVQISSTIPLDQNSDKFAIGFYDIDTGEPLEGICDHEGGPVDCYFDVGVIPYRIGTLNFNSDALFDEDGNIPDKVRLEARVYRLGELSMPVGRCRKIINLDGEEHTVVYRAASNGNLKNVNGVNTKYIQRKLYTGETVVYVEPADGYLPVWSDGAPAGELQMSGKYKGSYERVDNVNKDLDVTVSFVKQ